MSTVEVRLRPRPGLQIGTGVGRISQRVRLELELREQSVGVIEQPHLDEMCQLILTGFDLPIELLDAEALDRTAASRMADEAFRPAREPPRLLSAATGHRLVDDMVVFFRSTRRHEFRIGAVVVPGERISPPGFAVAVQGYPRFRGIVSNREFNLRLIDTCNTDCRCCRPVLGEPVRLRTDHVVYSR